MVFLHYYSKTGNTEITSFHLNVVHCKITECILPQNCCVNWRQTKTMEQDPRDALLARYMALCLFVSVTSREFCRNGRTNRAGFGHGSFLRLILHCLLEKFGYLRNNGTSRETLSQILDFDIFATASQSSQCVVNIAGKKAGA